MKRIETTNVILIGMVVQLACIVAMLISIANKIN